jgi:cytochrome c oxidase subunit 3
MTTNPQHEVPPAAASGHDPHLAHHFDSVEQQREAATQGMWLFLATEILLFGGLFCAYAVYRANHPEVFLYAHHFLDTTLGATNTVILLCSSFTMAAGVWAAQHGRRTLLVTMLALTLAGGLGFLGIKVVEYRHKWEHHLLWGTHYRPQGHAPEGSDFIEIAPPGYEPPAHDGTTPPAASAPASTPGAPASQPTGSAAAPAAADPNAPVVDPNWAFQPADSGPRGLLRPDAAPPALSANREVRNVQLFFAIYYGLTGLHGLHVIAGLAVIGWILVRALRGHFSAAYSTPVHMVGLYWHVVDLIWIYLFPLLYLIH